MSIFDDLFNYLLANFSEWIKIEDYKSEWTIEDFPYETMNLLGEKKNKIPYDYKS